MLVPLDLEELLSLLIAVGFLFRPLLFLNQVRVLNMLPYHCTQTRQHHCKGGGTITTCDEQTGGMYKLSVALCFSFHSLEPGEQICSQISEFSVFSDALGQHLELSWELR